MLQSTHNNWCFERVSYYVNYYILNDFISEWDEWVELQVYSNWLRAVYER